jgi:hypothetical protein
MQKQWSELMYLLRFGITRPVRGDCFELDDVPGAVCQLESRQYTWKVTLGVRAEIRG